MVSPYNGTSITEMISSAVSTASAASSGSHENSASQSLDKLEMEVAKAVTLFAKSSFDNIAEEALFNCGMGIIQGYKPSGQLSPQENSTLLQKIRSCAPTFKKIVGADIECFYFLNAQAIQSIALHVLSGLVQTQKLGINILERLIETKDIDQFKYDIDFFVKKKDQRQSIKIMADLFVYISEKVVAKQRSCILFEQPVSESQYVDALDVLLPTIQVSVLTFLKMFYSKTKSLESIFETVQSQKTTAKIWSRCIERIDRVSSEVERKKWSASGPLIQKIGEYIMIARACWENYQRAEKGTAKSVSFRHRAEAFLESFNLLQTSNLFKRHHDLVDEFDKYGLWFTCATFGSGGKSDKDLHQILYQMGILLSRMCERLRKKVLEFADNPEMSSQYKAALPSPEAFFSEMIIRAEIYLGCVRNGTPISIQSISKAAENEFESGLYMKFMEEFDVFFKECQGLFDSYLSRFPQGNDLSIKNTPILLYLKFILEFLKPNDVDSKGLKTPTDSLKEFGLAVAHGLLLKAVEIRKRISSLNFSEIQRVCGNAAIDGIYQNDAPDYNIESRRFQASLYEAQKTVYSATVFMELLKMRLNWLKKGVQGLPRAQETLERSERWIHWIDDWEQDDASNESSEVQSKDKDSKKNQKKWVKVEAGTDAAASPIIAAYPTKLPAKENRINSLYSDPALRSLALFRQDLGRCCGESSLLVHPKLLDERLASDAFMWSVLMHRSASSDAQRELHAAAITLWARLGVEVGLQQPYIAVDQNREPTHNTSLMGKALKVKLIGCSHLANNDDFGTFVVRYPRTFADANGSLEQRLAASEDVDQALQKEFSGAIDQIVYESISLQTQALKFNYKVSSLEELQKSSKATAAQEPVKKTSGLSAINEGKLRAMERNLNEFFNLFKERYHERDQLPLRSRNVLGNILKHLRLLCQIPQSIIDHNDVCSLFVNAHLCFFFVQYIMEHTGRYVSQQAGVDINSTHNIMKFHRDFNLGGHLSKKGLNRLLHWNNKKGIEYINQHFEMFSKSSISDLMHYLKGLYHSAQVKSAEIEGGVAISGQTMSRDQMCAELIKHMHEGIGLMRSIVYKNIVQ